MFKLRFCLSILFLASLLVGCQASSTKMAEVVIGQQTICVEVADRPIQWARGLSNRASLAANRGMLFIFPQSAIHSFWMKEMNFSLDIIWINTKTLTNADNDADLRGQNTNNTAIGVDLRSNLRESAIGRIVETWPNAPTPSGSQTPSHQPKSLANYVLEVSAGGLDKYGWRAGDTVKINFTSATCQNQR